MKVKQIKTKEKFKPFKVQLTFENETEVNNLAGLLSATEVTWSHEECRCYPEYDGLRDLLMKKLGHEKRIS